MEDLDPEEAQALIDPALRIMIGAVQRYEGYVVQSTGDGISPFSVHQRHMKTIRSARSTLPCRSSKNWLDMASA